MHLPPGLNEVWELIENSKFEHGQRHHKWEVTEVKFSGNSKSGVLWGFGCFFWLCWVLFHSSFGFVLFFTLLLYIQLLACRFGGGCLVDFCL